MKKLALAIVGIIGLLMGGAEFAAGIVLRHTIYLAVASAIALAVVGVMHWREKKNFQLPMLAVAAIPPSLEDTIVRMWPKAHPIQPDGRTLVNGPEGWICIVAAVVLFGIAWYLWRQHNRQGRE